MNFTSSAPSGDSIWQQEQVKLLYGGLVLSLILNLLLAALMLGIMFGAAWPLQAVFWFGILVAAIAIRAVLYLSWRRLDGRRPSIFWLANFRVSVLLTAAVWGVGAIFLFPAQDLAMQAYMAFVYAGISAAAITSLSADRVSSLGFLLLMLLPLILSFMLAGSAMQLSMAVMVTLFILFMTLAAGRMQSNFMENVRLREAELLQKDALLESEARFRHILDTCPTAARIARAGGHDVIFSNAQYATLINSSPDQVRGVDPSTYYAKREDYEDILARLAMGEQIFDRLVELKIPAASGELTKWALATYLPIRYQGSPAVLGWFHDISERIRIERMKSEFVSVVSHELRTPLTAITGAMGLIEGGVMGELTPQVRDMLAMVSRNSQRLAHLVNDLLDVEKLAAGKMVFELRDEPVRMLLEQAVEQNRSYGSGSNIRLILREKLPDAYIRVDRQRVMQIMANLLSNAIKFSPQNGEVEVWAESSAGKVLIHVRDHGPGIPEAFQSRIFEKFAQADSSDSRQKGGTGLGLAITRELVQHMGGEIGFSPAKGGGTHFHFSFPAVTA